MGGDEVIGRAYLNEVSHKRGFHHERAQGAGTIYEPRSKSSLDTESTSPFASDFPKLGEKIFCYLQTTQLTVFCYSHLNGLRQLSKEKGKLLCDRK